MIAEPDGPGLRRNAGDSAIGMLLAATAFALFHVILASTTRASVDVYFGADAVSNFNQSVAGKYGVFGSYKHLPAVTVYTALVEGLRWAGLAAADAVRTAAALLSALACVAAYACLRWFAAVPPVAFALTVFFAASNAVLTIFGIVETYALTCIAISGGLMAIGHAGAMAQQRPVCSVLLAGAAAGFAALCNAPAGAIVLVYMLRRMRSPLESGRGQAVAAAAAAAGLAILCSAGIYALLRWQRFNEYLVQYVRTYASLDNLLDPAAILDVVVGTFVLAFVSPLEMPQEVTDWRDVALFRDHPARLATLVAVLALFGLAAALIRHAGRISAALEIGAVLLALLGFYIFFNPREFLLYASQTTLLIVVLMAHGFGRERWTALPTLVVAAAMLAINLGVLLA